MDTFIYFRYIQYRGSGATDLGLRGSGATDSGEMSPSASRSLRGCGFTAERRRVNRAAMAGFFPTAVASRGRRALYHPPRRP
eukprot:scaffold43_cov65-Phaeocystis_antarctica.AAC.1